jgi:preprotein translocase subunit Sec63
VAKLIMLAILAIVAWRMVTGRWPWQSRISARAQALFNARKLLGVSASSGRGDIIAAHKRLLTMVHPDRGGSNAQVHEANAARDLLLGELPRDIEEQ